MASAFPAAQQQPLFSFHSNAWLNLHQFVRLAARGVAAEAEYSSQEERAQWAKGVEFYAPYAKRDLLFDQGMVDIGTALRRAEGKPNLDGITIDANLKTTLERLMPTYQKHWWPAHDRANREWIMAIQPFIDRHGAAISQGLTRTYGVTWPNQPIPVDLTVTAGPFGGYTSLNPVQVTISASEESNRGYRGARDRVSRGLARVRTPQGPHRPSQSGRRRAEGDRSSAALARSALLHRRRAHDA